MVKKGLEFKFLRSTSVLKTDQAGMDRTVDHFESSPRKMECDRVTRQESGSRISRHAPSANRSMALESSSARSGLTQNALPNLSLSFPVPAIIPRLTTTIK